jgi:ERCC4-type nuclease
MDLTYEQVSKICHSPLIPVNVIQYYLERFKFVRTIHLFLHSPSVKSAIIIAITFHLLPILWTRDSNSASEALSHYAGTRIAVAYPGGTCVFPVEIRG